MVGTPAKEKENMAGIPAREKENVAGILAREKEKGWDSSKDMWRGFPQEKGLGFQQSYGVANLISKDKRERKRKEIGITWHVWLKALKLCVVILLYYMDD